MEKHGQKALSRWQGLGLEPHYLPPVTMSQDASFPGWKIKPENWYYKKVAEGEILRRQPDGFVSDPEAFQMEGVTVLIDTRLKPPYEDGKQMFKNDNLLGQIIKRLRRKNKIAAYRYGPQDSRFGVSAEEWEKYIKPVLAEFLDVEASRVRLERAIEANVIPQLYPHMSRQKDGETNTWVWYEEYVGGASFRLGGGRPACGGLSDVRYDWADARWGNQALRPLVVLGD